MVIPLMNFNSYSASKIVRYYISIRIVYCICRVYLYDSDIRSNTGMKRPLSGNKKTSMSFLLYCFHHHKLKGWNKSTLL